MGCEKREVFTEKKVNISGDTSNLKRTKDNTLV